MNFQKIIFVFLCVIGTSAFAEESCHLLGSVGVHKDSHNHVEEHRHIEMRSCLLEGAEVLTLRSLKFKENQANLVVNPETLESLLVKTSCLKKCIEVTGEELGRTNYGSLLEMSDDGNHPMENDGVTAGYSDKYVALTIDMCPSSKGISQNVYDKLVEIADQKGEAVPIGVAMTATWKNRHSERFDWLKEQARKGKFKIQWINHSYHHHYKRKVPYKDNFMRKKGTDVEQEILGNEIAMLEGGVTPSVFFRFPGLVSSKSLMNKITDWGFVALGTDAWLGYGQKPQGGSIILIHGNRNEPKGEVKFMDYVRVMDRQRHEFGSLYDVFYN